MTFSLNRFIYHLLSSFQGEVLSYDVPNKCCPRCVKRPGKASSLSLYQTDTKKPTLEGT